MGLSHKGGASRIRRAHDLGFCQEIGRDLLISLHWLKEAKKSPSIWRTFWVKEGSNLEWYPRSAWRGKGEIKRRSSTSIRWCKLDKYTTVADVGGFAPPIGTPVHSWQNCASSENSLLATAKGILVCSEDHGFMRLGTDQKYWIYG